MVDRERARRRVPEALPHGVAVHELLDGAPATRRRDDHTPHVVAWNLTRRCNLECAHCYIAAGPHESGDGELTTDECLRIATEILELNPSPMFILSGGEPLLRQDLPLIAEYASSRGATVVVGTNGTLLTSDAIRRLRDAGVRGFAVSVDSLDAGRHDRFRHGNGALEATTEAIERLHDERLDFIVQTTIHRGNRHEIAALAEWSAERGAVSFNLYFLVATGRGARLTDLTPAQYDDALIELVELHGRYLGRMMVRAKCAPHFMRHLHRNTPDSPVLNYDTRCPCGIHYCRITPDGALTPCPYNPTVAGDLRQGSFGDIWRESAVFAELRAQTPGGKCGRCEYRLMCGGCRARALAVEGDQMAADPSCAYEPDGSVPLIERLRPVRYGESAQAQMPWTAEAEARMQRIPSFVRGVVVKRIEQFARDRGEQAVTIELMREVRRAMPVDFSKRTPFFLGDD